MFLLQRASFAIKLLDVVKPSDAVAYPGAGGPEAILQSAKTLSAVAQTWIGAGKGDVTGEGRKRGGRTFSSAPKVSAPSVSAIKLPVV